MCKATKIARSSFYYGKKSEALRKEKDAVVLEAIKHLEPVEIKKCGSKRKSQLLKRKGISVNHKRVARICKEAGIETTNRRRKFPKNYYKTQKANEENLPKNELNRDFKAAEPLKKLSTDVSYFKVTEGWLYLSPVLDQHDGLVLVANMSPTMDHRLSCDTLVELLRKYRLKDTMIHSDQGGIYQDSTYRSFFKAKKDSAEENNENTTEFVKAKKYDKQYEEAIKQAQGLNLVQSMSRKGNCWDNACMERFFGTVKSETNYYDTLKNGLLSYKEMERMILEFIEYYNNRRIQKKLHWMTPVEFRSKRCY